MKKAQSSWSLSDRQKFSLKDSDIYLSFAYEVGIIMPNASCKSVDEIQAIVFHCVYWFASTTGTIRNLKSGLWLKYSYPDICLRNVTHRRNTPDPIKI